MVWNVYRSTVTRYTRQEAGLAYLAVALFADSTEGRRYIEFQLADEEDRDWGYCIVDGPPTKFQPGDGVEELVTMMTSHATLYGGLLSVSLDGMGLVLTFDDEAQRLFEWPRELTLRLGITADELNALREGLPEVLAVGPGGKVPTITL
ncbi:hypothetical protein GCM10022255_082170 [Dactylosporangium darangshiense]|uniref:Uncharacterized protein n=1 Tax=Dactylosporangium darangshiense TaxID=579108 RepID=A0ABP8DM22_9ACTN